MFMLSLPSDMGYFMSLGRDIRPGKKNFGSGQLIFENWSGGPVEFFFEPQPIFSKSYFSTSHKTRDPDSTCIDMSVMAQSRLKCTQDEPEGLKRSCQHTDDHRFHD